MALTLALAGKEALPPGQRASLTIERGSATIGRSKDNDWALADPSRLLSGKHCSIECRGDAYFITDTSTNGVYLNRSPDRLGRGNTAQLNDGDLVSFGQYEIEVRIGAPSGAAVAEKHPAEAGNDTFFGKLKADFGVAAAEPPAAGAGATRERAAQPLPPDPLGDPLERLPPLPGLPREPVPELIPDDIELFGRDRAREEWRGPSEADHVPSSQEFFAPPQVRQQAFPAGSGAIPEDWDKEPAAGGPAPASSRPAAAPQVPERPSRGGRGSDTLPPASAPPAAGTAGGAGDAALLASFLAASGLAKLEVPDAAAEATMQLVGRLFREIVGGLRELLMTRAEIKSEMRVPQTQIRPKGNNPLKFSASVEEAMTALLRPTGSGYLAPDKAIEEAVKDLRAHELAVMAGVQEVLATLLKRFDPKQLEERLKEASSLASVLPGARKARYWEVYTELYREIAREAEDDFSGFFGREFARAYMQKVTKL